MGQPAREDSGYVDGARRVGRRGWGGELKGQGASLDVLNESASLSLPEDVAETDSSAKRRQPVAD